MGDAYRYRGKNGQALAAYLKSINTICSLKAEHEDSDINDELTTSMRSLSEFLSEAYSPQYASEFWQKVAEGDVMGTYKERAQQEAARLRGH